ncbi:MAG: hypothetical protein JSW61_02830 [Candidatus Thorarchaeota archaeon]|nr:MAG: hypothetical protein JSW61_02830 [Candidatus Thorarchaeota archaeon]
MNQLLDIILVMASGVAGLIGLLIYYYVLGRVGEVVESEVVHRSYAASHSDKPLTPRSKTQYESDFARPKPDMMGSSTGFYPARGKSERMRRDDRDKL